MIYKSWCQNAYIKGKEINIGTELKTRPNYLGKRYFEILSLWQSFREDIELKLSGIYTHGSCKPIALIL